ALDLGNGGSHRVAVGDVEKRGRDRQALRVERLRSGGERLFGASVENHLRTGARQALGDGETQASMRTRNQCNLAREIEDGESHEAGVSALTRPERVAATSLS